ncbi:MAG: hypothetical protein Q3983_09080 [Capnocytophaga sp.]|nr:hypothetical protein [Capnocytophaga sp.]
MRQNQVIDFSSLPKNSYTNEEFANVWKNYILYLTEKGERLQISNLGMDIPKIENNVIHIEVPTEISQREVLMQRENILGYIQKGLQNYAISLEVTLNKDVRPTLAYTPEEKLEELCTENEYLKDFIEALELQL